MYEGPGTYRHYKGSQYEVLGLALQEDSLDKKNDPYGGVTFVIYRPLTTGSLLPARGKGEKFWARELSDFNAQLPKHGPRFTRLSGEQTPPGARGGRPMTEIDRERWRQLQVEFGCDEAPLGNPRVHLTDAGLSVEFGDGESHVSVWATQRVTRIDMGGLELYVSPDWLLLLHKVGPYPIQRWQVLYDSSAAAAPEDLEPPGVVLMQQLIAVLRDGLYHQRQVDETDPAVPLVKEILTGAKHPSATLAERAVQIVRTVRATIPLQ